MVFFEVFDTLQKFADTLNKREVNSTFKMTKYMLSSQIEGYPETYGTENFSEATNLLLNGDSSNLGKLKSVNVKSILRSNDYTKNMLKADKSVCGCLPNVPLCLIGAPNNMLNFKSVPRKSRILNLVVNISVDYRITTNQIIEAGANIASIIKELEKNKIRVNVYITCFVNSKDDYVGALINIKKSSSPLNMLNVAYPLINPSMLRRHFFRYIETIPAKINERFTRNYGVPVSFKTMLEREPKLNKFKGAIVIDVQNMIETSVSDMVKTISERTK